MFPALLGAPRYPAWPRGALPAAGGAGRSRLWAQGRPPTLPRRHPGRAAGRLSWGWARGANSLPSLLQEKRTGPCRAVCKVGAGRTRRHGGSGGPCREDRGTGRQEGTGPWRPGDSHRTFHQTPASHRSASRRHGVASRPAAASRAAPARTRLSSRPPPGDTAWRRHLLRSAPGSRSCFRQRCRTAAREILLDLTGSAPDPGPECTPMVAVREAAPARQTCDCMSDRKHVIRHMCVCVCVCALSLTETLASYIICIKWILREKKFFLICGFPIFFYSDPQLMNCQAYLQKYVYIFSFHISEFLVPQSTSS